MNTQNGAGRRLDAYHELYVGCGAAECWSAFIDASARFLRQNRQTLLDVAMESTCANVDVHQPLNALDPLLRQAISLTNPGLDEQHWLALSGVARMGAINTAKGKYFEYLVTQRLNEGQQVGDVLLSHGQHAVLADSITQPGWDLRIVDDHGHTVDYLQLKATKSIGYVRDALHTYPDIQILSTSDVAHAAYDGHVMLDSGMHNEDLQRLASHGIDVADASITGKFVDYFSPLLPLIVIGAFEGYKVSVGKATLSQFRSALARRSKRLLAIKVVGASVYAFDGGLMSVPAAFAGGIWYDRLSNQTTLYRSYEASRTRLIALKSHLQDRTLQRDLP